MLPLEVLERAGSEITNYEGSGMSVMEMSHRSKVFQKIFDDTQAKFRRLFHVPDGYHILFLQGGASTQFAAAPMNLIGATGKADYAVTGNFSNIAYKEAKKYGAIHLAASSEDRNHTYIPAQDQLELDPEASYFYYCANNTIYGTEWQYVPTRARAHRVRHVLRHPLPPGGCEQVRRHLRRRPEEHGPRGPHRGHRQERAGRPRAPLYPADDELQDHDRQGLHVQYAPCWCIYMLGLVLDWLEEKGGVEGMEAIKHSKARMLYDTIDAVPPLHLRGGEGLSAPI